MPPISKPERVALYRLFDRDGAPLYIGISANPPVRLKQHSFEKAWWPEVASNTVEWFDDRASAARAEESAIRSEAPRHNKQFHPDYPPKVEIPDNGLTLTQFRQRIVAVTDHVERTGEVLFLYSHGKRVAALIPARAAMEIEASIQAAPAAS